MNTMRTLIRFISLAVLGCQLFFCGECWAGELRIGLMTGLSGPYSSIGEDCRRGYELARAMMAPSDRVGVHPVKFLWADHKGEAKSGVSEFKRLTEIHQIQVLVSDRSQVNMAINPLSKKEGIPLVGITAHSEFVATNPYSFRFWPSTKHEARAIAEKAVQMGKKRVAVVSLEDEYTVSVRDNFAAELKERGGKIIYSQTLSPSETELATVVSKIKESRPDAILINLGLGQTGVLVRRIREQGLVQQLFATYWMAKESELQAAGPEAAEGTVLVNLDLRKPKFIEHFRKLYSEEKPNALNYTCYSALAFLLEVLSQNPSVNERRSLYQALLGTSQVVLSDGPLLLESREAVFDLRYMTIRDGVLTSLSSGELNEPNTE